MKSSYTPLTLSSLLCLVLCSCSPNRSAQNWVHKTQRQWAKLEKQTPSWAEMLDSHALATRLQFLETAQTEAEEWRKKPIDPLIKSKVEDLKLHFQEVQTRLELQQKDPSLYNLGLRLQSITDLKAWGKYLDEAPKYYLQARKKLSAPEPLLCDSAIQQHIRSITLLQTLANTKEKAQLDRKISRACFYMKDYLAWCRSSAFEARDGVFKVKGL